MGARRPLSGQALVRPSLRSSGSWARVLSGLRRPVTEVARLNVSALAAADAAQSKLWCVPPLDYHNPAGFNCKDETEFRNFIVWLEDQKIRHYKIEDRGNLRNIHSSDWPKFFEKYLRDVNCPFKIQDRQEAIDWLLGLAVRLEYGDNAEKYKDLVPDNTKNADNAAKNAEPLINLDVNNPDFKAGVMALANLLQIQRHDDYLVMLKAIRILVQERLTQDAVAKANQTKEGLPVALDKHILGFDTGDAVLNEAAQILRLLHIEELRELQTKINEAIVAVQAIIADPKTDHRLGKVGR